MSTLSDYNLWKAALLVKPTRTTLYDIVLRLGGDSLMIAIAEENLQIHYIDKLSAEEFHRFCLFNILVKLRNRHNESFPPKLIYTLHEYLGATGIEQMLQDNDSNSEV